jgi:hypothetical protein
MSVKLLLSNRVMTWQKSYAFTVQRGIILVIISGLQAAERFSFCGTSMLLKIRTGVMNNESKGYTVCN